MASVEARLSTHQVYAQYSRSHARSKLVVAAWGFLFGEKGHVTANLHTSQFSAISPANPEDGELRQVQDHLVQSV